MHNNYWRQLTLALLKTCKIQCVNLGLNPGSGLGSTAWWRTMSWWQYFCRIHLTGHLHTSCYLMLRILSSGNWGSRREATCPTARGKDAVSGADASAQSTTLPRSPRQTAKLALIPAPLSGGADEVISMEGLCKQECADRSQGARVTADAEWKHPLLTFDRQCGSCTRAGGPEHLLTPHSQAFRANAQLTLWQTPP